MSECLETKLNEKKCKKCQENCVITIEINLLEVRKLFGHDKQTTALLHFFQHTKTVKFKYSTALKNVKLLPKHF